MAEKTSTKVKNNVEVQPDGGSKKDGGRKETGKNNAKKTKKLEIIKKKTKGVSPGHSVNLGSPEKRKRKTLAGRREG